MEKSANIFRFKQFSVANEHSAMKVNTDGVLLGALMTILPEDRNLLDIGTGTGTIALMAAQRLMHLSVAQGIPCPQTVDAVVTPEGRCRADEQSISPVSSSASRSAMAGHICEQNKSICPGAICIDAIDVDEPSATEAAVNFRSSPWSDILHAHHVSLDDFASLISESYAPAVPDSGESPFGSCPEYDLIFSNPPYFDNALQAPEERRNAARHTATGLSYREILDFAAEHLTSTGRVAMVLPADTEHDLTRHARMSGLHLHKITRIRTVPRKAPSRIVAEFSRQLTTSPADTILTIQDGGQYTQEYLDLMHEFYLFA